MKLIKDVKYNFITSRKKSPQPSNLLIVNTMIKNHAVSSWPSKWMVQHIPCHINIYLLLLLDVIHNFQLHSKKKLYYNSSFIVYKARKNTGILVKPSTSPWITIHSLVRISTQRNIIVWGLCKVNSLPTLLTIWINL